MNGTCPVCPVAATAAVDPLSLVTAVVLVVLSGLFSGLNLGLMSFTADDLGVVIKGSDDPAEVRNAEKILPLRRQGNLLLCSLLLGNTLVNALIAVLLASIASGVVGTIATTGLIVVFGEIIPQAVCSRNALSIGAVTLPLVYVFVVVCFPIAYPISIILDNCLGREISGDFNRSELHAIVKMNAEDPERARKAGLTEQDGKLIGGALTFRDRTVGDVMTPLASCFALPMNAHLDYDLFMQIARHGHTRVPVFESGSTNIIAALLNTKDLLGIGFERNLPIQDILEPFKASHRVHRVHRSTKLDAALEKCKRDHVHLLVVTDDDPGHAAARAVGIATFEDIIEEILQEEIVDETDVYVDAAMVPMKDNATASWAASTSSTADEGSSPKEGLLADSLREALSQADKEQGALQAADEDGRPRTCSGSGSETRPRKPSPGERVTSRISSNKNLLGYDNTMLLKSFDPQPSS